jgi:hypothetical protein
MSGNGILSEAKDVVLFALAIYAAALSTFNWRQAVRRDRRVVSVNMSTATPFTDGTLGPSYVCVEAVNVGYRPVTVGDLRLELPEGARFVNFRNRPYPGLQDARFPQTLTDGASARIFISYADIGDSLLSAGRTSETEIIPACTDSAGGVYKGKAWIVNPREWAHM